MSKGRAEKTPEEKDEIIKEFLLALGLKEEDVIVVNVVDKEKNKGEKRTFSVGKIWFFTPWMRARNAKGKEIFLTLSEEFLVLDDMKKPMKKAANIQTSKNNWHNILKFDRPVENEVARAIKAHFGSDPSARKGTRLPEFKNVRKNFWVEWDGSRAEELNLEEFLQTHGIKIEQKREKEPPTRERKKRRVFRRRFEPDWHELYQNYLLRNGGDYSRADFFLVWRLFDAGFSFHEAVDVLRSVSLSFRPREHQRKSQGYWEHTVRKAAEWYREPEPYREPDDREPPAPGQ